MKYSFAVAALVGAIKADAPPYYDEPPFSVETHPSAAGLIQVQSACARAGEAGVTCTPGNAELFATGMNGDEDLGEDITMKGEKFHYNQRLAQFATGMNGDEDLGEDITMKGEKFHYNQKPQQQNLFATGMNGDEDLGEDITMKGEKFHYNMKPQQQQLFATGMNGDEDLGEDITMKGEKFHYNQRLAQFATGMNGDEDLGEDITMKGEKFHYNQKKPVPIGALMQLQDDEEASQPHKADWTGYTWPDKVHTLDPKTARTHTSFYAQK